MRDMLVEEMGEFQLIELLAETIAVRNAGLVERLDRRGFRTRLTIGDDAAAWVGPRGLRVLTTDTMVEGVHFNLDYVAWRDLGWKALAVNLSDVAAMGCYPSYAVVTLGLRGDLPCEGLVEMYEGMMDVCERSGGAIVGGDIVQSPALFVTVALEGAASSRAGHADGGTLLTRGAASPGDKIAVTGELGCSAGGLRMLLDGLRFDGATAKHLMNAHHRPMPRVTEGMALLDAGVLAAIDISDGLVDDLGKICRASGVGATIRSESVPVDQVLRGAYSDDWLDMALGGGEDYELLFTAPSAVIHEVASMLHVRVSVIGDVVEGQPVVIVMDEQGEPIPARRDGWDHLLRFESQGH